MPETGYQVVIDHADGLPESSQVKTFQKPCYHL